MANTAVIVTVVSLIPVAPSTFTQTRHAAGSLTLAPRAHAFPPVVELQALEGVADSMRHFQ